MAGCVVKKCSLWAITICVQQMACRGWPAGWFTAPCFSNTQNFWLGSIMTKGDSGCIEKQSDAVSVWPKETKRNPSYALAKCCGRLELLGTREKHVKEYNELVSDYWRLKLQWYGEVFRAKPLGIINHYNSHSHLFTWPALSKRPTTFNLQNLWGQVDWNELYFALKWDLTVGYLGVRKDECIKFVVASRRCVCSGCSWLWQLPWGV